MKKLLQSLIVLTAFLGSVSAFADGGGDDGEGVEGPSIQIVRGN